jgi:hypothetical protein
MICFLHDRTPRIHNSMNTCATTEEAAAREEADRRTNGGGRLGDWGSSEENSNGEEDEGEGQEAEETREDETAIDEGRKPSPERRKRTKARSVSPPPWDDWAKDVAVMLNPGTFVDGLHIALSLIHYLPYAVRVCGKYVLCEALLSQRLCTKNARCAAYARRAGANRTRAIQQAEVGSLNLRKAKLGDQNVSDQKERSHSRSQSPSR